VSVHDEVDTLENGLRDGGRSNVGLPAEGGNGFGFRRVEGRVAAEIVVGTVGILEGPEVQLDIGRRLLVSRDNLLNWMNENSLAS